MSIEILEEDGDGAVNQGGLSNTEENKQVVTNMRFLTRLISDMSKYTILIAFAMVSSFIFILLLFVFVSFIDANFLVRQKYGIIALSIDNLVNSICLVLQFDFFKKVYKVICNKCHVKCEDRYTNETNKHNVNQLQRLASRELGFKVNSNAQNNDRVEEKDADGPIPDGRQIGLVAQKSMKTLDA